jgi:uncharacterized protein YbjT (DUF2867 family)
MSRILVIGANGTVGSELVRLLAGKGHDALSATSRPATAPGQVSLNLVTGEGLAQAFERIERVFMLSPPGHTNQDELLKPVIDQAVASGLRKLVLMTAMGANADEAAPMRKAEVHLEKSGLAYNIIRPNWFMQNFHTYWLQAIREQAKILLPVGSAKGSFIDARDIAAVAASLLDRTDLDNTDFDLTGPEALDHDQVAAILSKTTGRAITFEDITPDAMLASLLKAQVPRSYAEFLVMILGYFKAGYSERTTDAVKTITGSAPRSFERYAAEFRQSWLP